MNANKTRAATWAILTFTLSIVLAANSFSNYQFLARQLSTASPPTSLDTHSRFSQIVWIGDTPAPAVHHAPSRQLHALRRGLLVNTSLALVLVFAVAAPFSRRRP